MVVDVASLQCPRGVLNGSGEPCVHAGLLTRGVATFSQGFDIVAGLADLRPLVDLPCCCGVRDG
jgi:hypothetical protein